MYIALAVTLQKIKNYDVKDVKHSYHNVAWSTLKHMSCKKDEYITA